MSSLTRRLHIRQMKAAGVKKRPVVTHDGDVVGWRWPFAKKDLFFLPDGSRINAASKHPTLQPVIDALAAQPA